MDDPLPNPALKEWAAIWQAVLDGRQLVDLRKGGIREQSHRFRIRAGRFWLYDSFEHQQPALLRPGASDCLAAAERGRPGRDRLRFRGWAELVGAATLARPDQLDAIEDEFIWTADYAQQRLQWRPKQPLWLLFLRAYRLQEPIEVPLREEYAGCASWVPMRDLPANPGTVPADPVLTDGEFAERYARAREALGAVALSEDIGRLIAES